MRKANVVLPNSQIATYEPGDHACIVDGDDIYLKVMTVPGIGTSPEEDGEDSPNVVDDTAPPKKKTTRGKAAPKAAPKAQEESKEAEEKPAPPKKRGTRKAKPKADPREQTIADLIADEEEIPQDEWTELEEGDGVKVLLKMEGEEGEKLWEADIVSVKAGRGKSPAKVTVKFVEDGETDDLREGDRLFEFSVTDEE